MSERNREAVTAKVMEIAERVGASQGIEVVDVQLLGGGGARLLRIFIDKIPGFVPGFDKPAAIDEPADAAAAPNGVTLADCEFISHNVGTILDIEDVIPGAKYTLEVSSPGVERKLTRPRDFERSVGQKVKVALRQPEIGRAHV